MQGVPCGFNKVTLHTTKLIKKFKDSVFPFLVRVCMVGVFLITIACGSENEESVMNTPTPRPTPSTFEELIELGNAMSERTFYASAVKAFEAAYRLNPDSPEVFLLRGIAYNKLGEYKLAIADFNQVLRMIPEQDEAFYERGSAFGNLNSVNQARDDFSRAININPEDPRYFNARGFSYATTGKYEEALGDYDKAVLLDPTFGIVYANRAVVHAIVGNDEAADKDLLLADDTGIGSDILKEEVRLIRSQRDSSRVESE